MVRRSWTDTQARSSPTATMGTLTYSTHRHDSQSVSRPPSRTPRALPQAATIAQTPTARARALPSLKVTMITARLSGARSAPASP
ncbi:hypothetical protein DT87_24595 [Streptomyces sp. NTK 937]|nr:hypothetical protein DT87_24595 [Streptomyces sp. NTK 937]